MAFLKLMFPLSSHYLQDNIPQTSEATKLTVSQVLTQLEESDKVVIVGPDRADKTSLVFQSAVTASASGVKVAHVCTHPLKHLPAPVHGMVAPDPDVMRNVDFIYLEEASELIAWFAGVHTRTNLPSLIIIEDILTYASQICERNIEKSLARLCATISDAAAWIASHTDLKRCQVLMTAPSRISSLASVLSQFHFTSAAYQGPGKDDPNSQLTYESDSSSVSIKFCHMKDAIRVVSVQTSVTKS